MIVAAAIQIPNGLVLSVPAPARHDAVILKAYEFLGVDYRTTANPIMNTQGFLDDTGKFLDRREAFLNALASGQLNEEDDGKKVLVSEDLW